MPENIIEVLQAIQNERFAQESAALKCGNAVFNNEMAVKIIEQELEKKRQVSALLACQQYLSAI
jgi:hypothetical protein